MIIKIVGKEKTLEDLEKAQKLIKEPEKILYGLPLVFGLEAHEGDILTKIINNFIE